MRRIAWLIAIFVFAGSVFAAPAIQPDKKTEAKTCEQSSTYKIEPVSSSGVEERIAKYTGWLAGLNGILAIAAIIQFCFIWRADKTARLAAEAAQRSAETLPRIERAYVFIADLDFAKDREGKMAARIRIKNTGKTPAIVTGIEAGFIKLLGDQPKFEKPYDFYMMLNSGEDWDSTEFLPARKDEAAQLFYGRIYYRDIFGDKHRTWYCFEVVNGPGMAFRRGGESFNGYD